MRQKSKKEGAGAERTLTFIVKAENKKNIGYLVEKYIEPGSVICADENPAYDNLYLKYKLRRVNHSQEYCAADGTTNNLAESYFSRFRRLERGQVKLTPQYLDSYANEIAYREDTRRWPNGAIFVDIAEKCLQSKPSPDWAKYCQGNKRLKENVVWL